MNIVYLGDHCAIILSILHMPYKNPFVFNSGLPFPSPGDLPDPGIKFACPALAGSGFFTTEPPGKSPVALDGPL